MKTLDNNQKTTDNGNEMTGANMATTKAPETILDEMLGQINLIVADASYRDQDEPAPSEGNVDHLKRILKKAYEHFGNGVLPPGDVSCFFGELSVTWRLGARQLRVDIASDGRSRMHSGSFESDPKDRYAHESGEQDDRILARVDWLVHSSTGASAIHPKQ